MSSSTHEWVIYVNITPPFNREPLCAAINCDREFMKDFAPLPTAREIFWEEAGLAAQQKRRRVEKIRHISKQFADYFAEAILGAIEKQDTIDGYKRSEL